MSKTAKTRREDREPGLLATSPTHLLHRALQLAEELHAEVSGPGSLTQRQHTLLAAAASGQARTQNDLVLATGIDRSTLAELVARMLAKGLLERERSASDGRAKTVRLSGAGRAALDVSARAANTADARLLAILPAKRRGAFVKALGALALAADQPPQARRGSALQPEPDEEARGDARLKPAKAPKLKKRKRRKAKNS